MPAPLQTKIFNSSVSTPMNDKFGNLGLAPMKVETERELLAEQAIMAQSVAIPGLPERHIVVHRRKYFY